jgi:hypothetical protein
MIRRGIGVQPYTAVIGGVIPLLDTYGSAAAAYSLRKLRSAYTGSAVRVRRSSDNTEQDIGFDSNGNLDQSALTTFCGVGNGFVTTWYDQSGNSKNLTESSATSQPQIVSSGAVITLNNKIALNFDGSNDKLINTTTGYTINNTTFLGVYSINSVAGLGAVFSTGIFSGNVSGWGIATNGNLTAIQTRYNGSALNPPAITISTNTQYLNFAITTTNSDSYWLNNGLENNATGTRSAATTNQNLSVGVTYDSSPQYYFPGKLQEAIFWSNNNLSASRSNIQSNINTYYTIY